jgi:hypothetical protein
MNRSPPRELNQFSGTSTKWGRKSAQEALGMSTNAVTSRLVSTLQSKSSKISTQQKRKLLNKEKYKFCNDLIKIKGHIAHML